MVRLITMKPATIAALLIGAATLGGLPQAEAVDAGVCTEAGSNCRVALAPPLDCRREGPCLRPSTSPCPDGKSGTVVAGQPACADAGRQHPCPRSEDDPGFGGTHVTCYYACARFDALAIMARAHDPDADVSGYTDCGGARASCDRTPQACAGVSDGLAEFDDAEQGCVADSHEFYSSTVTVVCVAAGRGLVCRLTKVACPTMTVAGAAQLCLAQNQEVSVADVERLVAEVTATDFTSFVAFEAEGAGPSLKGFVVRFDATAPEPTCWAGPL